MIQVTGNLWDFTPVSDPLVVRCITTNGTVTRDGRCVMGRGCALEASKMMPTLPLMLGKHLHKHGNVCMGPVKVMGMKGRGYGYSREVHSYQIMTFPVKHNWFETADVGLIRMSADKLKQVALLRKELVFILPKPGCGNGHLDWSAVKQWLTPLPNNVYVIDFK